MTSIQVSMVTIVSSDITILPSIRVMEGKSTTELKDFVSAPNMIRAAFWRK